jgi:hypothetical protein
VSFISRGEKHVGWFYVPRGSTAGKASRPEAFTASAFNSGTAEALAQNFQLQAEPANNNTASPSGTLNLLYAAGTAAPAETGLKISNKGVITFAPGHTFPGGGAFCIATAGGFGSGGTDDGSAGMARSPGRQPRGQINAGQWIS